MTFAVLAWMFVAAISVHNTEEAIWLPAWSKVAGNWHQSVGSREFRFALAVLTAIAVIVAVLAIMQGKQSVSAYLLCGYALAMLINVAVPHVLATLVMRRYAPGTATAVLLNLPVTSMLLQNALAEGYVDRGTFIWVGPLVALTLVALIPILLKIGREV